MDCCLSGISILSSLQSTGYCTEMCMSGVSARMQFRATTRIWFRFSFSLHECRRLALPWTPSQYFPILVESHRCRFDGSSWWISKAGKPSFPPLMPPSSQSVSPTNLAPTPFCHSPPDWTCSIV